MLRVQGWRKTDYYTARPKDCKGPGNAAAIPFCPAAGCKTLFAGYHYRL